ncbi:MAG: hypothetical protein V4508_02430 [Pseudomonadota bacterium]
MKIKLTQEKTFTARAGTQQVHGLRITSEWEGLRKLVDGTGRHLIVDGDVVVKGTPALLHDLSLTVLADGFIKFPQTTLPGGRVVPAFEIAARPCSVGADGVLAIDGYAKPRVNISYREAKKWLAAAGRHMLTASQGLAIALDIAAQDVNWTGGKVGAGAIYQGIHLDTVSGPQDASYEPAENERRWHRLSTGDIIWDFSGNVSTWMHDDLHGDDEGLVKGSIPAASPLLTSAPAPSEQKGVGWIPKGPLQWSSHALIRGGRWCSHANAGVFALGGGSPDGSYYDVGVRCTK